MDRVTIVRLLEYEEKADAAALAHSYAKELETDQLPDVRLVRRSHPHVAFRLGFPEYRLILAYAPHAVVVSGDPQRDRLLAQLGVPVIKRLKREKLSTTWNVPKLSGPVVDQAKAAGQITILGPGVAAQAGDGLTIGTDPLSVFAGADFYIHRNRTFHVPAPDSHEICLSVPYEDVYPMGSPGYPFHVEHPRTAQAILRSSALWPTTDTAPPSRLVSAAEVYREDGAQLADPWALLVIALRRAGCQAPMQVRLSADPAIVEFDTMMALHQVTMGYGVELHLDGEAPEDAEPIHLRIDLGEITAGFLVSGVADWLEKTRGTSPDVLDKTTFTAHGLIADFVASLGYRQEDPPAEATTVTIAPPKYVPLA